MASGRWVDRRALGVSCRTEPRLVSSWGWPRIHWSVAGVLVGSSVSVVLVSTVLLPTGASHRAAAANVHTAGASAPGRRDLLVLLPERQSVLPGGPKLC